MHLKKESTFIRRHLPRILYTTSKLFVLFFCLFLIFAPGGVNKVYVTTRQIVFHLLLGVGGIKGADSTIMNQFIFRSVIIPFYILSFATISLLIVKWIKPHNKIILDIRNKILWIIRAFDCKSFYIISLLCSFAYFALQIDLKNYIKSFFGKDQFTISYFDPNEIKFLAPKNQMNLILIYVESLEAAPRDPRLYGSNLLKPLDNIDGQDILHFPQVPGTEWTMAGMVASQCAIPLKPFYVKNLSDSFFPGLVCLGDVLQRFDYEQYFFTANDLRFGNRDTFYKMHGYKHLFGKDQWKEMGVDPNLFNGWGDGLHDDTLLDEVKKIILANHANKTKYNMTILTTDTHFSNGYQSPRCELDERSSGFKGAYKCSAKIIAHFIKDLQSHHVLDNTLLIIMGDHLFMTLPTQVKFFPEPRNVYFKIVQNGGKLRSRNKMNHFDVAPTILDIMGFLNQSNSKFGLGISLFSDLDDKTYESHFEQVSNDDIINSSIRYNSFLESK